MTEIMDSGESAAFYAATDRLAESGWSFEGDTGEDDRRAFEIVWCAGRDYGQSALAQVAAERDAALGEVERLRYELRVVACRTVMYQDGVYFECQVCGGCSKTVPCNDEGALFEAGVEHRPECLAYPATSERPT
jgi:hypothetical protein